MREKFAMERMIARTATTGNIAQPLAPIREFFDRESLLGAALGGAVYFLLAFVCLNLSKFDSTLASVWLPNAAAVAILLRTRMKAEVPLYIGIFAASTVANMLAGTSLGVSLVFSIANVIDVAVVVWMARRGSHRMPDMTDLADLARFALAGGVVGPLVSASVAALAMGTDRSAIWSGATSWFLTDSLGMLILAPSLMIAIDAWRNRRRPTAHEACEWIVLTICGTLLTIAIFAQGKYPFLFFAAPIVILHAFRLGALGTAFSINKVAIIAILFTSLGTGPVNLAEGSLSSKLIVLQAFLASAFMIGLPVAATLAGRERMMDELEQGRDKLQLLAANITDAILRYDLTGICTYASPSVRDVLGEDTDVFVGRRASNRMHQDARERILLAEKRLLDGSSTRERFTYRRFLDAEDGSPIFIEANCAIAYHPGSGAAEGIVVSARDVTERVELEKLLTRARLHAEEAARAKSEFLANMSHEIRTPMNGVLGFAELMLQGDLDADQRRQTEMIVQSGRSMMLLLNDILDLSKIEAGQIAIHHAPVDLHATLSDCISLHRPGAEEKGIELRFEGPRGQHAPDRADWVMTDGLRLRQIVLNLVGNAVKFTQSGSVRLSYTLAEDHVAVSVSDTGIGIDKARLESIFQPFTQAESDTTRRYGGTGLGLTISRQLAELLGGTIEVDSEPGAGSCFTLRLPTALAKPDRSRIEERPAMDLTDLPGEARILLAEDHDINRMLATEMLGRCGQRADVARDGNEAVARVLDAERSGAPYDLVLMDIQMPGCDGYAATRAIRAEGIGPETLPIVALTANAFPEDIAAAQQAGMQGHLAKPLEFSDFVRVLKRWLPARVAGTARAEVGAWRDEAGAGSFARSPELMRRWRARRSEAIDAVRAAREDGSFAAKSDSDELAILLHKLAGTAAMFGEEALGERAATLERALRGNAASADQLALANELIEVADQSEA
ncbi:ATP-binding protein [Erythrobacter sp. GH1-10]|uniref:ATP-binding protein n=1 Tax=Erythrobacter sp. GH1-10 TaxID=3349334 RepID=UPI003877C180